MARYHREFLIPYLQNVCALHLADRKLYEHSSFLKQKIVDLKNAEDDFNSEKPVLKPVFTIGRVLSIVVGMCGVFCVLVGTVLEDLQPILRIIFLTSSILLVCIFLCGAIYRCIKAFFFNQHKLRVYKNQLAELEENEDEHFPSKNDIPALQIQLQKCISENHRIHHLLNQVYCANIIPRPFRNIHSAIYLYDWFRTSREDNLDMALTMIVHNQNKEKQDQIIPKNSSVILEQSIALANQQYSLDYQRYHQELLAKLNQITTTPEEHNTYLSMIESIAMATAYFAASDYLKTL